MIRTLIESLLIIAVVLVARSVLTSIMRGIARASSESFKAQSQTGENPPRPNDDPRRQSSSSSSAGELHKDPVCGTYVSESTALKRQVGGQTFYYCSEACREKHALVAR